MEDHASDCQGFSGQFQGKARVRPPLKRTNITPEALFASCSVNRGSREGGCSNDSHYEIIGTGQSIIKRQLLRITVYDMPRTPRILLPKALLQ